MFKVLSKLVYSKWFKIYRENWLFRDDTRSPRVNIVTKKLKQLSVLEERVARLEAMVEVQPEALHGGGTLSDVAGSVLSRMALLDPEQLGTF